MCLCPASGLSLHIRPVAAILPQDRVPDRVSPKPLTSGICKSDTPNRAIAMHPRLLTQLVPVASVLQLVPGPSGSFFFPHSATLQPKTVLSFLLTDLIHTIHPLTQSLAYTLSSFSPLDFLLHQLSKTTTQIYLGIDLLRPNPRLSKTHARGNHQPGDCIFMVSNLC